MMDERVIDERLSELFKRSAPCVDDVAVQEKVRRELPRRRRRSHRGRTARTLAIVFASIVLAGGAAYGTHELVDYLRGEPTLVITDATLIPAVAPGDTAAFAGITPVAGTGVGEQFTEGASEPPVDSRYASRITGQVRVYSIQMSEPAYSGTVTVTLDVDLRIDGSGDMQGSWVLSNDEGSWECDTSTGYCAADYATEFLSGTAIGSAAYEGLTLHLQWYGAREAGSSLPVFGESLSITGWVQSAD